MQKRNRIHLLRTQGEWDKIYEHIDKSELDWNRFWIKKISDLKNKYKNNPNHVTVASGDKATKVLNFSEDQYKLLEAIALQMQKPVASVIDELIIAPILATH